MITALALALSLSAVPTADVEKLGRSLEADFAQGVDALSPVLDMDALVDRTLKGVDAPDDFRRGFTRGFKSTGGQLGAVMAAQVQKGARITFRKVVTLEGEQAAQLRMLTPDGSFNVFELVVKPGKDGKLKVVDLYDLVGGELKSQEIRRMALAGLAEVKHDLVDKLMGKEQVFIDNLPKLKAMAAQMREGKFADAVKTFRSLPKELQEQRTYLRLYTTAAANLDEKEYERALGRYLAIYPDDASSHVMALDFYFLKKKWAELEKAIDLVEKRVGADDAWLEVLRANGQEAQGKRDEAKKHLMKAIGREKDLRDPYFMLLGFSLQEKKYGDTAKWLAALEKDAGVPLADVSEVPEYAGFAASKEGKAFIKKQRAAKKN